MTSVDESDERKRSPLPQPLPLDPEGYSIRDAEKEFFKNQTGITDDDELKEHILEVQKQAYSVAPYPCIRIFAFLRLTMSNFKNYHKALKLEIERPGAIYLEVGAGLGIDLRKLVSDGYLAENIVATDLHEGLWQAGHSLFKSNAEKFPVSFVPGDIFRLTESNDEPLTERPDIPSLRSLAPLKGHVSVIYTANCFHVFPEERQKELTKRLAALLSPEKGSLIFGIQLGVREAGLKTLPAGTIYLHSPDSWKELWAGIFGEGAVQCDARLREHDPKTSKALLSWKSDPPPTYSLIWGVERL